MTQRVAIVTGAGGGIGRATVDLFRRDGWYVIGLDRAGAGAADQFICADHSVAGEIEAAFEQMKDLDHVDAVVNNAAMHVGGGIADTTPEQWDLVMATNLRAAYLVTRLSYPMMRARGGAIVNISSVHAVATSTSVVAYATSKGGLLALTRASSLDLASDGIRVNAVLPGAVDTPMLLAGVSTDERGVAVRNLTARTPLRRIGRPDEIAQAILFLADDERSSFITGQTLIVDGGALARLSTE